MANDVTEYLAELKGLLGSLTSQEQDDVMEFYSEYLQDAGVVTRSEVESRLGTPKQLARKVLADYSIKDSQKQTKESKRTIKDQNATNKSNVTMIWLVILAIASSPVTIPLALGVLLVLAGAILAVLGVLFAAIMGVLGVGAIALFAIYVGIMMIPGHLIVDAQSSNPTDASNIFLGAGQFTFNNADLNNWTSIFGMNQASADQFIKDMATTPLEEAGKTYDLTGFQLNTNNQRFVAATAGLKWQFDWGSE